jgi:hypothetical protein
VQYVTSLYWSVTTIATVGYGELGHLYATGHMLRTHDLGCTDATAACSLHQKCNVQDRQMTLYMQVHSPAWYQVQLQQDYQGISFSDVAAEAKA